MEVVNKKTGIVLVSLSVMVLFSGCTNWKKKYSALNVENQNTQGLLQLCETHFLYSLR